MKYVVIGFRSGRTVRFNQPDDDFLKKLHEAIGVAPNAARNYLFDTEQQIVLDLLAIEYVEVKETP